MERRRAQERDGEEWKPLRRGWCLGREPFRASLLQRVESQLGEHHSGRLRLETAAARADRTMPQG